MANYVKNDVRSLSKNDVVFCEGAIDVGRNNSKALHQITNFITDNRHTNIILLTAPHRYDVMQASCVNSEITSFNRKLRKMAKVHHHASVLEMPNVRNPFNNHSLHLNGQGKETF
jgi:DNA-binding LacI/PurR family transcriptional regulator